MKLYGLTGGIGMGKSAAADLLRDRKVPVVDTDAISRDVVQQGEPGLNAITNEFGPSILAADRSLNRSALGQLVFRDPAARARLEAILHPLIRERWLQQVDAWRKSGATSGVVVIPLLFETGAEQFFESVICIASSVSLQSARLQQRGWDAEQVTGRLAAQWPIEKKMDRSHFVIWNDSSFEVLREQLGRVPPLKGS